MTLPAADRRWLDAAARQAAPFRGSTGRYPTIGAIVVDPASQALRGRAVTGGGGKPRAVAAALDDAGRAARGATLYLTLGVSVLDAEDILAARIVRLVLGLADPEPDPAGGGLHLLQQAGIEVGLADHQSSRRLHEGHLFRIGRNRPFVTAALAVSADGKLGRAGGGAPPLGESAQLWLEAQRARADAVMVGWGTAHTDPDLGVSAAALTDHQPLAVLVAGFKTYDPQPNQIVRNTGQAVAVIATSEKPLPLPEGIELIRVPGLNRRPQLAPALAALANRGIQNLFVSTGPTLLEALLAAGLVDRFHLLRCERAIGADGIPMSGRGGIEARIGAAGFSLVDHRLLGADNLRTFERIS